MLLIHVQDKKNEPPNLKVIWKIKKKIGEMSRPISTLANREF